MMTKDKLLELLKSDIVRTEKKIKENEHPKLKNVVLSAMIKCGIAIKYCVPFIVSSIMVFYFMRGLTDKTIFIDKVKDKAYMEYMITSTGIEKEKISYDMSYSDSDNYSVSYNIGWYLNDNNEYERKEIIYDYYLDDTMFDINKISQLSKEFLDETLSIRDVKTYTAPSITLNDEIYSDDMVIFKKYGINEDVIRVRNETIPENLSDIVFALIAIYFVGKLVEITFTYCNAEYIDRKLNELDVKYRILTKEELIELKKILVLKKKNLDLLEKHNKVKQLEVNNGK